MSQKQAIKVRKRKTYSRDFKAEAVKLIIHQGYSIAEASRHLDVDYSVLRRWKNKLEKILINGDKPETKEKALNKELQRLKSELDRVKEERNILLKALSRFVTD